MKKKKIAYILGIRPDVIRSALILKHLRASKEVETTFIWSGQHYSDNLKDIFFRELQIAPPEIELGCRGETDAEIVSKLILKLYTTLQQLKPDVAVFLGDTNTVMGSIAALELEIPIVHIEGCMRNYDWRMPEERYRTTVDHIADLIYSYIPEYKRQGVREGLNPKNIMVVGNPIVDILQTYYVLKKKKFDDIASESFFKKRGIEKDKYYLMTCHRRENVHIPKSMKSIITLAGKAPYPVYFAASYRTQKVLKEMKIRIPNNIQIVDPVGYEEVLTLLTNSRGIITDSGTLLEEACILHVPSLQVKTSCERPQVYEVGASVKFDPHNAEKYPHALVYKKFDSLYGKTWKNPFGDGKSSKRIADDLIKRVLIDTVAGHRPRHYHIPIARPYQEDGIKV